jgi:hypothetical protein
MRKDQFTEEMKLTYSGVFHLNGKVCSSVCFERGKNIAEGIIPDVKITKNSGFSSDEIIQLEKYLKDNTEQLMSEAQKISTLEHILS